MLYISFLQLVMVDGLIICTSAGTTAVQLGGDGVSDIRELLLLLLKVLGGSCLGVLLKPVLSLLDSVDKLWV